MPPAESLRGLGPLTQKHLRSLMLCFLEVPAGGTSVTPLYIHQLFANTVCASIKLMNMLLVVNVHGSDTFQKPKKFSQQVLEASLVLKCVSDAASTLLHPSTAEMLPPSPLDEQHLKEWRETADYAATTLVMLAGMVDLETSFKSPLLGGSGRASLVASL
jgi:hypothetical protein